MAARSFLDTKVLIYSIDRAYPAGDSAHATVAAGRTAIRNILAQEDRRMLVIVGPCSIHDEKAALEYAEKLAALRADVSDQLELVMRVYFEKPRTTVGWKGLINDPHLNGSFDIDQGLRTARQLLLAVTEMGLPTATEVLDPFTPQYISDLISWASIGARTTESQTHREMASGLSMPVGFKNGTDGSLDVAANALISAGSPHVFLGINAEGHASVVRTTGNPDRHVVLRGGTRPNYYRDDVEEAAELVAKADPELKRSIMVDTSHGNSSRDYRRQGMVCRDVVGQFTTGQNAIMGLLIESNLAGGRQNWERDAQLQYGVSITDACIDWEETESLLQFVGAACSTRAGAAALTRCRTYRPDEAVRPRSGRPGR